MTKNEIIDIFNDLNKYTVEFWEVCKAEDQAKLKKIAAYKKLQLARQAAASIKFD